MIGVQSQSNPPISLDPVTILDVREATELAEDKARVESWARAVREPSPRIHAVGYRAQKFTCASNDIGNRRRNSLFHRSSEDNFAGQAERNSSFWGIIHHEKSL